MQPIRITADECKTVVTALEIMLHEMENGGEAEFQARVDVEVLRRRLVSEIEWRKEAADVQQTMVAGS